MTARGWVDEIMEGLDGRPAVRLTRKSVSKGMMGLETGIKGKNARETGAWSLE